MVLSMEDEREQRKKMGLKKPRRFLQPFLYGGNYIKGPLLLIIFHVALISQIILNCYI